MSDGQDNDHPHLTNRHFSQNDQKRDDRSSSSHDTRPFLFSDAITSVGPPTWGPNVRCHNQGRRWMGSAEVATVVPTREGVARASQIWQDGGCDRIVDVLAPGLSTTEEGRIKTPGGKTTRNATNVSLVTRGRGARLLGGGKDPARERSGFWLKPFWLKPFWLKLNHRKIKRLFFFFSVPDVMFQRCLGPEHDLKLLPCMWDDTRRDRYLRLWRVAEVATVPSRAWR